MVIPQRAFRRSLWAWTALTLSLAAAMWYAAASAPLHLADAVHQPLAQQPSPQTAATRPSTGSLEPLLKVRLRQPLYDKPTLAPVVQPVIKPSLTLRLAGTIMESGFSKAVLLTPDGRTELKSVGQRSGEAEILSIEEKKVTVRFHGEVLELKVATKGQG